VVNGYPDVSEETRARVLETIEALGYKPNRAARVFRTGRTQTISVILPMVATDFYNRLVNSIDAELAQYDYDAALFPLLSQRRLERYRDSSALPYHADGLLISSLNPDDLFPEGVIPAALPTVLIDIHHPKYDTVTLDNVKGGYLAGQHIAARPAKTFAIMIEERFNTPFASGVFRDRLAGFKQALHDAGQELPDENIITVEFSWDGGRIATLEILKRHRGPLNIFASCDLLARGVLDELSQHGLSVGKGVRLIGFDDQPWAESYGLCTIRQPIEAMGAAAVNFLLQRMSQPDRELIHQGFEPRLVVRPSSRGGESIE
jgi:LacI family transcriptional regulator